MSITDIAITYIVFYNWVRVSVWACEEAGRRYVAWRLKRAS